MTTSGQLGSTRIFEDKYLSNHFLKLSLELFEKSFFNSEVIVKNIINPDENIHRKINLQLELVKLLVTIPLG